MGQGCSADQPNGGHVERTSKNMEAQKSPVFIGQMASSYGGGGNSAPQGHCPGAPSTLPTPPCGGRTNNCEAKGEAQRGPDKPENITCNVTEYELTCKWEPRVVPKTCTVMVPQYKAVCAGQKDEDKKKIQATIQRTYQVDTRFDANNDGVIQQAEFEAARAGGGLTAMGGASIVGGGQGGGGGGGAMGGGGMVGGAQMGAAMGGAQMGGFAAGGGGGGFGGGAQMGGHGGAQMGGVMGGHGAAMGGHGGMGGGGGYGN